ncbi:ligand-binding sensor domain-containing protein [Adhaeribacter pallidiroseus]|uniref:HTH luxR-type domain-containing protein n=1 Tax=Adhaeribacter pallidiroseus TaxID=2072847 RepID=A0A369QRQ9_9BACT|nr:two-component regulator propeller domain-containing protein [Adhaeribacter pallidiroseus]RDC65499.1 hypothetical protein AHMF7616_04129 [Adhaeribacter pallidiroseus]
MLVNSSLFAQLKNEGVPFINNFTQKNYKASPQNGAIVQDNRGVLFFGNNYGFLEYDGNRWRLVELPNKTIVRSLAKDNKGRIYVGGQNDFGYLQPDAQGQMSYVSLKPLIPQKYKEFEDVWDIYPTKEGVYFATSAGLYRLQNNQVNYYPAPTGQGGSSFYVQEQLFMRVPGKGIYEFKNGRATFIPNSEALAPYNIVDMLPFTDNRILMVTMEHGIFVYDGYSSFKPWKTPAEDFFKKNRLSCAIALANGYAIGSTLGGLLLLDQNGNPQKLLNRENGLQNSHIQHIYQDNSGNLWLGLNNGIDYVEINSPFTLFNAKNGVPGTGYASFLHAGKMYLGTNDGLYCKKWPTEESPLHPEPFQLVAGTQGQVNNIQQIHDKALLAHHNGPFELINDQAVRISEHTGTWLFLALKSHPGYVLCGTYNNLLLYKLEAGNLVFVRQIAGFKESSRIMEEDAAGNIWISHVYKGIYKLKLSANLDKVENLKFYDARHGFPSNLFINVYKINNQLVFTGEKGIYQYNPQKDYFEENEEFSKYFDKNKPVRKLIQDREGNIWFAAGDEMGVLQKRGDGTYTLEKKIFNKLQGRLVAGFEHIAAYNPTTVIIGTNEGFVRYNPTFSLNKKPENAFSTLIRQVEITGGTRDSLLTAGAYLVKGVTTTIQPTGKMPHLPYRLNSLRFTYSATAYEESDKMQYQYFLEGYDKNWSAWTVATQKEYTNLVEGTYVFHVRGQDIYNKTGTEATYTFTVSPPWYRTGWAYAAYIIIGVSLLLLLKKIIEQREKKERERLQQEQEKALRLQEAQHAEQVLKAEKEIIKLNNDKLENELQHKNKELASSAMHVTQSLDSIQRLKDQLQETMIRISDGEALHQLRKLLRSVEEEINFENNWEQFEIHFNQIHQDFIKRLRCEYPQLTHRDIKLCTYLRLNLSSKEIASLLNLSLRGIETSRYRIRKKMNLEQDINLTEFILKY